MASAEVVDKSVQPLHLLVARGDQQDSVSLCQTQQYFLLPQHTVAQQREDCNIIGVDGQVDGMVNVTCRTIISALGDILFIKMYNIKMRQLLVGFQTCTEMFFRGPQNLGNVFQTCGSVYQLVRARDCQSLGRRFDSV